MAAALAFVVLIITELIATSRHEPPNPFFNGFAGLLTVAAFVAGGYAMLLQFRSWSQSVRRRLRIGLTIAVFTLVMVSVNGISALHPAGVGADGSRAETDGVAAEPEDQSLFKSGWYGELQQDGVLLVIASFPENAAESRRFNRRIRKDVSYATLSVVNLGSPAPVTLRSLQVTLLLDSGEAIQSLDVRPLLQARGDQNRELLARLETPLTLVAGGMAPDIPICFESQPDWDRVRGVKVTFLPNEYVVRGRILTADQKREIVEKPARKQGGTSSTNVTAESWFKGL